MVSQKRKQLASHLRWLLLPVTLVAFGSIFFFPPVEYDGSKNPTILLAPIMLGISGIYSLYFSRELADLTSESYREHPWLRKLNPGVDPTPGYSKAIGILALVMSALFLVMAASI